MKLAGGICVVRLGVFFLIAFLHFNLGFAAAPAKGAAVKKTATVKKVVTSKKNAKLPLHFLTFEQLARLEFTQRVKYLKQLRALFIEAERAQLSFRNPLFAANDFNGYKNYPELYVSIFQTQAYAADPEQGRGRYPSDQCIYAYQLSTYEEINGKLRQPFLCALPTGARCSGLYGPGVECGELSGLSRKIATGRECIPDSNRHNSTVTCDRLRDTLSKDNTNTINNAVENAKKIFKLNMPGAVITDAELGGKEAQIALQDLADHRYNDRAHAQLISVVSLYKKYKTPLPIDSLGKDYASIQPAELENEINQSQANFSKIFESIINHCEAPVASNELDIITSSDNLEKVNAQMGAKAAELETRRFNAYKILESGKSPNGTITKDPDGSYYITSSASSKRPVRIEDLIEIDECFTLKKNLQKIGEAQESIITSYPKYESTGQAPTPLTPPPTPVELETIRPIGCSSVTDDAELSQPAARCMICLAQKAMVKYANHTNNSLEKDKAAYYVPSNKWLSLLSTMVVACGDGASNGKVTYTKNMLNYLQTFGHCSNETYAWRTNKSRPDDSTADLRPEDEYLVNKWAQKNLWAESKENNNNQTARDLVNKDNESFRRIYGVSYTTATDIFCNPTRFVSEFDQRNSSFIPMKIKEGLSTETPEQFIQRGRKQLREAVKDPNLKNELLNANAGALFDCINESFANAEKLYSGGPANTCLSTSPFTTGRADEPRSSAQIEAAYNAMKNDVIADIGAVAAYNGGGCKISRQVENKLDKGYATIVMTDPSDADAFTPNNESEFKMISAYQNQRTDKAFDAPSFVLDATPPANMTNPNKRTNLRNEEPSYSFTYPDQGLCASVNQGAKTNSDATPTKKTR